MPSAQECAALGGVRMRRWWGWGWVGRRKGTPPRPLLRPMPAGLEVGLGMSAVEAVPGLASGCGCCKGLLASGPGTGLEKPEEGGDISSIRI